MIKPSDNVIRAILNLDNNLSFEEITTWIRDSLYTQSIAMNHLQGEATIKAQGRNLELEEILKHIKNAHNYQEVKGN